MFDTERHIDGQKDTMEKVFFGHKNFYKYKFKILLRQNLAYLHVYYVFKVSLKLVEPLGSYAWNSEMDKLLLLIG